MRLMNTVAHHAVTIRREDELGINHWPSDEYGYFGHHYFVGTPEPLRFFGSLDSPSRAVDYRIYQPRLMLDFMERGGNIEYRAVEAGDLEALSEQFDLLVVCTGKGSMGEVFGRKDEDSPFRQPQRVLCAGLFKGIAGQDQPAVTMHFVPGVGEMIEIPTLTFNGMATALVIENLPGGDMEIVARTRYEDDPQAFRELLLGKLRQYYPDCAQRIDEEEFDVANSALDILQGAVTPVVRHGHAVLGNGKLVVALGDVQATVDPVLGQGANMASHAAVILAEEIERQNVFDERFCELVEQRRSDRVLSATRWTNFMLQNLKEVSPGLVGFIQAISQDRSLSDKFTDNFNYPEQQWDCFASGPRTGAWIEANGSHIRGRVLEGV